MRAVVGLISLVGTFFVPVTIITFKVAATYYSLLVRRYLGMYVRTSKLCVYVSWLYVGRHVPIGRL